MKRISILLLLIGLLAGCTATKTAKSGSHALDGTWVPVKQEMGGKELPAMAYAGQKLVLDGKTYVMTAESVDKGEAITAGDKMDIYGKEGVNTGKHFTAIYKLEGGKLTICYNLVGDSYPTGFETTGKPMLFMSVFEKSAGQ